MENLSSRRWTTIPALWYIKFRNDVLQLKPKTFIFMDCIACWWGWYGCSSPSTKGLHGLRYIFFNGPSLASWGSFLFFSNNKFVDFSSIQTGTDGVEGNHADHKTTTSVTRLSDLLVFGWLRREVFSPNCQHLGFFWRLLTQEYHHGHKALRPTRDILLWCRLSNILRFNLLKNLPTDGLSVTEIDAL